MPNPEGHGCGGDAWSTRAHHFVNESGGYQRVVCAAAMVCTFVWAVVGSFTRQHPSEWRFLFQVFGGLSPFEHDKVFFFGVVR